MGKIRDFYTGLPLVTGVESTLATIYALHLGELFDYEVQYPKSILARRSAQTVAERMRMAYLGWAEFAQDKPSLEYGMRLGNYTAAMYGLNKKDEGDAQELAVEKAELQVLEPGFPKISALITVADASTVGAAGTLSSWA